MATSAEPLSTISHRSGFMRDKRFLISLACRFAATGLRFCKTFSITIAWCHASASASFKSRRAILRLSLISREPATISPLYVTGIVIFAFRAHIDFFSDFSHCKYQTLWSVTVITANEISVFYKASPAKLNCRFLQSFYTI